MCLIYQIYYSRYAEVTILKIIFEQDQYVEVDEKGKRECELVDYIKEVIVDAALQLDSQEISNIYRIGAQTNKISTSGRFLDNNLEKTFNTQKQIQPSTWHLYKRRLP
ncbi:hypothetical protein WA026_012812 [Henosepilachna vigintioctopunctata]|uniref:Uncharacterized protein n=1 Tax=Henosepilachna vigintioctopunctata TaxID=420089 RepID=A0AAW1TJZ7_9CUCU